MRVIHRRKESGVSWSWEDVVVHEYNSNSATKQVLIGHEGGAPNFEMHYFTISPHGFSSFDNHAHDHGVVVVNGRARVHLGDRFEEVGDGMSFISPVTSSINSKI